MVSVLLNTLQECSCLNVLLRWLQLQISNIALLCVLNAYSMLTDREGLRYLSGAATFGAGTHVEGRDKIHGPKMHWIE